MDSLRWDVASHTLNNDNRLQSPSSIWNDRQPEMDLTEDVIFNQIQASRPTSNLNRVQSLEHEGIVGLLTSQDLFTSIQDFSKGGVSTESLESLDGLISTTNSYTDTSVEDDGISMLFSAASCQNLWSFGSNSSNTAAAGAAYSTVAAASSGEFANVACEASNHEIHCPAPVSTTDLDEGASQSSSDPLCGNRNEKSSPRIIKNKDVSRKRTIDGQLKVGQAQEQNPYSDCSIIKEGTGFRLISEANPSNPKKPKSEKHQSSSTNINFQQRSSSSMSSSVEEPDPEAIAQMKEMIYRAAAFRPVNLGMEIVEKPKRKNVKISSDPQTVAARLRRERMSERIRVLQRLVPGGSKMDIASMLDEAANYLKFLRSQVKALENLGHKMDHHISPTTTITFSSLPFNHHGC